MTAAISGQSDPLDQRSAWTWLGRIRWPLVRWPARRSRTALEVHRHQVAGDRRGHLRATSRLLDETAIAIVGASAGAKPMNHEWGSPLPPSSAVPDLPAVVTPGTLRLW